MICHKIGLEPIVIIGLGLRLDSSLILVPSPPAKITNLMKVPPYNYTNQFKTIFYSIRLIDY